MGLHRFFILTAEHKNGDEVTALEARKIEKELDVPLGWYGMLDRDALYLEDANWYDWKDELGAVAANHPDIVFSLYCAGDSLDDTWQAGFCGDRFDLKAADLPPLNMDYLRGE